jgi:hypothetical protein
VLRAYNDLVDPRDWPSLTDELAVASNLFGDQGYRHVARWLEEEEARIVDPDYVRLFTDHIRLPGVVSGDFAYRSVHSSRGALLGGIRFRGRDVARPFVEIVCHTFGELDELRDCVRAEWAMFAPGFLRLRAHPGRIVGPNVLLDVTIHAARCRDMASPDGLVDLRPFDDVEEAIDIVDRRYKRLATDDPELARNVYPASAEELREWHAADALRAIRADGATVGLLAIAQGRIGWIGGDEINEEVILMNGRGHAASAQAAWARSVAPEPDRLMVGMIDRLNVASRKTAERAGRPRVLDAVFSAL